MTEHWQHPRMLSIVCWKWGSLYGPEYVNKLRSMLDRHLHLDHKLFCITDDAEGIDGDVTIVSMMPDLFTDMASPSGKRKNFRRVRIFDKELAYLFGPRLLQLDLDTVIVKDVTPMFDRPEPLVAFDQTHSEGRRRKYNPSMILMDTGVLHQAWSDFHADPQACWKNVQSAGGSDANNSDQAIFSFYARQIDPPIPTWIEDDGALAFYKVCHNDGGGLPEHARIVLFFGDEKPHQEAWQQKCPWIQEHWR